MSEEMKKSKKRRLQINFIISLVMITIAALLINRAVFANSPYPLEHFWSLVNYQPLLFTLNFLPILLLSLLLYFLYPNAVFSISISGVTFISLSLINSIKIKMRQDPLVPTDISLVTEITSLLGKFNRGFVARILLIAGISILLITGSIVLFRATKLSYKVRFLGIAVCILAGAITNISYYRDSTLYDKFAVEGNYYFKVNHYICKGFLYSFLHDFNTQKVVKPSNYSKSTYEKLEQENSRPIIAPVKPHIIMVMGEAFSDLSINEHITFDGYRDPLENYKKLIEQENTISGHIIVPNFGGGTADTEFDVLSACVTNAINNSQPSYSFIRKKFDALPARLKSIGYDTLAIHPGDSWFYNRFNVYNHMGFDKSLFLEDSFDIKKDSISGYISEQATMDKMIETFEQHLAENENPLFQFCVTIQNHGPYTSKYGIEKNFNSDIPLEKEQENMLSNYFYGVADADEQIQGLVSYFEESQQPVVLVYFGDHLPGFPSGLELFEHLDYPINIDGSIEERLNLYKTPFFIWENESAKKLVDIRETAKNASLADNVEINSSFLGSTLTQLLGFEHVSPLFDYANELREEYPILTPQGYMDKNGQFIERIPEEDRHKIHLLYGWTYYKIFDEFLG